MNKVYIDNNDDIIEVTPHGKIWHLSWISYRCTASDKEINLWVDLGHLTEIKENR